MAIYSFTKCEKKSNDCAKHCKQIFDLMQSVSEYQMVGPKMVLLMY